MKIYKTLGGLLAVALLANACGGAAGGAPGDEGGAPGETGGTLLIDSTLSLRSLHLNTDVSWGSEPHQLTTGAMPHFGAVFSPNASEIAFVEYHEDYQSGIFMIPNHRGAAIEPDDSQLITRTNVRRLVGWLP